MLGKMPDKVDSVWLVGKMVLHVPRLTPKPSVRNYALDNTYRVCIPQTFPCAPYPENICGFPITPTSFS